MICPQRVALSGLLVWRHPHGSVRGAPDPERMRIAVARHGAKMPAAKEMD